MHKFTRLVRNMYIYIYVYIYIYIYIIQTKKNANRSSLLSRNWLTCHTYKLYDNVQFKMISGISRKRFELVLSIHFSFFSQINTQLSH